MTPDSYEQWCEDNDLNADLTQNLLRWQDEMASEHMEGKLRQLEERMEW